MKVCIVRSNDQYVMLADGISGCINDKVVLNDQMISSASKVIIPFDLS